MKIILEKSNKDLLRELSISKQLIESIKIPIELKQLKEWLERYLKKIYEGIEKNLYFLSLNDPDVYTDVLNFTQNLTIGLRVCNENFLPTICRYNEGDDLSLKVLYWLHSLHNESKDKPFAISNGSFAVLPSKEYPIIYRLPVSAQKSLLNIPLFFHEFGHLLYLMHKIEMDELVRDFQKKLEEFLLVPFQQNDEKHRIEREKAVMIIETWYKWMQEFFCDAVGIYIGGASYLNAFSYYLRMMGNESFYRDENNLGNSSHPVTWLRVKLLVHRAKLYGLDEENERIENDWLLISKSLKINEDYHGYYTDHYFPDLFETLNHMLTEAGPINHSDYDGEHIENINISKHNYIQIANFAWRNYLKDETDYNSWEKQIIEQLSKNK